VQAVTVGVMTTATPEIRGNALAGIAGFLEGMGIARTDTRDGVEDVVAAEIAARNLDARMLELRFGTLLLAASPQAAQLLKYETDRLHAALEDKLPGVVRDVRVRVERTR
jgi:hypothetical protein